MRYILQNAFFSESDIAGIGLESSGHSTVSESDIVGIGLECSGYSAVIESGIDLEYGGYSVVFR